MSRLVETFSGKDVAANAPIVGRDVFTQTAGIHADGDAKGDLYGSRTGARALRSRSAATRWASSRARPPRPEPDSSWASSCAEDARGLKVLQRIVELGDKKHTVVPEDLPYIIADVLKTAASPTACGWRAWQCLRLRTGEIPHAERAAVSYRPTRFEKGVRPAVTGATTRFMNALKKAACKGFDLAVPQARGLTECGSRRAGVGPAPWWKTMITWKSRRCRSPAQKNAGRVVLHHRRRLRPDGLGRDRHREDAERPGLPFAQEAQRRQARAKLTPAALRYPVRPMPRPLRAPRGGALALAAALVLAGCRSTPDGEERYAASASALEVVAVLRRHVPDDTYRFEPARDFTGRNVYRSSLLRLENLEQVHADALRAGQMDGVIAFAKGRALERPIAAVCDVAVRADERKLRIYGIVLAVRDAALVGELLPNTFQYWIAPLSSRSRNVASGLGWSAMSMNVPDMLLA